MIGILLSLAIFSFGIFLKTSNNEGFRSSKKFAWLFIVLGIITFVGKLTLTYLEKK